MPAFFRTQFKKVALQIETLAWVPDPPDAFLWRLPFGRFMECPWKIVWDYWAEFSPSVDEGTLGGVKASLLTFQRLLHDTLRVPIWIQSGTLLGTGVDVEETMCWRHSVLLPAHFFLLRRLVPAA
jgi:hypothetical protein